MASYVIPGTPIIKQMEMRLQPYLGTKVKYINLANILYHLAENCFFGNVLSAKGPIIKDICGYSDKLPVSEAEDMIEEVIDYIKRYIWRMINEDADDWSWHFEMTPRCDIFIHQLALCRPKKTAMQQLTEEVQEGVDNGDWYPESLRRHLGVKGTLTDI